MPQTLLAFLAMMIASMAAFNQHAATIRIQEQMIRSELEIMANSVALEAVEFQAVPKGWGDVNSLNSKSGESQFSVDDRTVDFRFDWDVRFVSAEGVESASETDIREVTISVYHPRYTKPLVQHSRLIAK